MRPSEMRTMSRTPACTQLFRDREHAPFRHARAALGAGILEHDDVVRRGGEVIALDLARHVVVVLEGERRPAMLEEPLIRRRWLHHTAARCEVAGEDGGCAFRVIGSSSERMTSRKLTCARVVFTASVLPVPVTQKRASRSFSYSNSARKPPV